MLLLGDLGTLLQAYFAVLILSVHFIIPSPSIAVCGLRRPCTSVHF